MSSRWSPLANLTLADSRFPHYLRAMSALLVGAAVGVTPLPLWCALLSVVVTQYALRDWQPRLVSQLRLENSGLWVTSDALGVQLIAHPERVLRAGPWLALQTPKGWLHVFADQAPLARLQPFYQWLWLEQRR